MDLQIVILEQGRALKKLGYPQLDGDKVYFRYEEKWDCTHIGFVQKRIEFGWVPDEIYAAPTLMKTARWLEKNKNIICWPSYNPHGYYYVCVTHKESSNIFQDYIVGKFYDYELALNAAINVALKVLDEFEQKLEKEAFEGKNEV